MQNYIPFSLYCKVCPEVENINLASFENHIRIKDPERYKTKLLEPLNKEKEITQQQESEKDDIFEVITATRVTKAKE